MNILQSTIEKSLYLLIVLLFIVNIAIGLGLWHEGTQINQILSNHTATITRDEQLTQTIKTNQLSNSNALEDFIRNGLVCIFTITPNPSATTAQITTEVDNCFKNTPAVR